MMDTITLEVENFWGTPRLEDKFGLNVPLDSVLFMVGGEYLPVEGYAYGSQNGGHGMGNMPTDVGVKVIKDINGFEFAFHIKAGSSFTFVKKDGINE